MESHTFCSRPTATLQSCSPIRVTVGCICGGKHLGGVIVSDNGGGNGDSVGGNGDLMLWPFLAAAAFASATSFLSRPMLPCQCFIACSNSRACAWYRSTEY